MRNQWTMYAAIGLLSIATGFVIGGGPGALRSRPDAERPLPSLTPSTAVPVEEAAVATTLVAVADTEAPATSTSTTLATSSTSPAAASTTSVASTTTSTTSTTTTTSTTEAAPSTTTAPRALAPSDLAVAVANASSVGGLAAQTAARLSGSGYDAFATNAADYPVSTVFYRNGFAVEAQVLAADAGLSSGAIAPVASAPVLAGANPASFDLILVLGADNDPPPSTAP